MALAAKKKAEKEAAQMEAMKAKEQSRRERLDKALEAAQLALQRLSNDCDGDLSKLKIPELRSIIERKTHKVLTGSHTKASLIEKCRSLIDP